MMLRYEKRLIDNDDGGDDNIISVLKYSLFEEKDYWEFVKLVGYLWLFSFICFLFGIVFVIRGGAFVFISLLGYGDWLVKYLVAEDVLEDL